MGGMDEENRVPDPIEIKAAAKVLMSKLGSYGHALEQSRKYSTGATLAWQKKTEVELAQQWSTLRQAMAQLGFDA